MINLTLLREEPERIKALIKKKDPAFDVVSLIDLDSQLREIRTDIETMRHRKNELAELAKTGVTEAIREESIKVGKSIKIREKELEVLQESFDSLYLSCPNLLSDDVQVGDKSANIAVKVVGKKPTFDFPAKNHLELGEKLGWFDFEAGTKMAGSQFPLYKGIGAKVLYALTTLMLKNNQKHGFNIMLPPCVINELSLITASNFPKFKDQVYAICEDQLYLSPTAEVTLTNLYRDHIFKDGELPVRMTAWTSCFRREAGGYGATERGLIRIHQFEKVEIYTLCEPEKAQQEHELMIACAENILQMLGLHYRVSLLAAQDCSFASAKTFDIEVWLPGQQQFYEVSSSSNCTDFQARRGAIRYKVGTMKKPELVYTLNTSSLAIPRLMVAILETHQQADGSVVLPVIIHDQIKMLFGE